MALGSDLDRYGAPPVLMALWASAQNKTYTSEASPMEEAQEESSACYFPGWTAQDFQLGATNASGNEVFTSLGSARMLEQVLPSPSLLDPKDSVTVVVALRRTNGAIDGLAVTTEAEYIAGERALFSKPAYKAYAYTKKALALMASTYGLEDGYIEYRQAAIAAFPNVTMTETEWNMFAGDTDLAKMQHRFLTHFLNTMLSATENVDDIKVLKGADKATWFESMYGINRIPYVASYLRYTYDVAQPLLVSPIQEAYETYDYTKYSPITGAEGIELARAAMRYYTWGVDYSIPAKPDTNVVLAKPVYDDNKAAVASWTTIDTNNISRTSNYFTGSLNALDLSTIPGTEGLPTGWAAGLNLDSPYKDGKAGSPLPYARGASMSPRNFASAMLTASARERAMKFTLPPVGAGVDGLGLVTGALAMSGLYSRVENLESINPAVNLDTLYKTGTTPTVAARLSRSDLEKASILVPDLSQIQVGDLVVHYGDKEGQSKDPMRIGIVVYTPSEGRPLPGEDPTEFLKKVVIVGANEGDRQVGISTLISAGSIKGFLRAGSGTYVRRLIASAAPQVVINQLVARSSQKRGEMQTEALSRGSGGATPDPETPVPKMLISTVINSTVIRVKASYECDSTEKTGNYRWIPNTGEYLVLERIYISVFNGDKSNIDPGKLEFATKINQGRLQHGFELILADRGSRAPYTSGENNIYNNRGMKFELMAIDEKDNKPIRICTLERGSTFGLIDDDNPMILYDPKYDSSDIYDATGNLKNAKVKFGIIEDTLTLSREAGNLTKFAIRPAAGTFYPGEDVYLVAAIQENNQTILGRTPDSAYYATYDKKMLWRANLYIDEGDLTDWNNIHPWNAPPGDTTIARNIPQGGIPAWGKKADGSWDVDSWGYNEWNRVYDGTQSELTPLVGLTSLLAGNGGQKVKMVPFVPERTLFGKLQEPNPAKNVLRGTVAYSFPAHPLEPGDWPGASGSMDSPFDYNKKMAAQSALLKSWYNLQGKKFAKSRLAWPNSDAISASSFASWEQYKENVTGPSNAQGILTTKTFDNLNINSANWNLILELSSSLAKWNKNTPPEGRWWNYLVEAPKDWNPSWKTPGPEAFLPSLGNLIGMASSSWDEKPKATIQTDAYLNRLYVLEAGADCVGFVQRSTSWRYSSTPKIVNNYKWNDLPDGIAEYSKGAGASNIWSVMGSASGRSYPTEAASTAIDIVGRVIKDDPPPDMDALRRIVPGDILVKDNKDEDLAQRNHIAIVLSVPEYTEQVSVSDYLDGIILIESELTCYVQSTINFIVLGDYDNNRLSDTEHNGFLYPGVSIPAGGIELNCKAWTIRRLKCN